MRWACARHAPDTPRSVHVSIQGARKAPAATQVAPRRNTNKNTQNEWILVYYLETKLYYHSVAHNLSTLLTDQQICQVWYRCAFGAPKSCLRAKIRKHSTRAEIRNARSRTISQAKLSLLAVEQGGYLEDALYRVPLTSPSAFISLRKRSLGSPRVSGFSKLRESTT